MLAPKQPSQRLVANLLNDAISHPLPELRLRRPKLFSIAAHHEGSFLLSLLFFRLYVWLYRHERTPQALCV
jgi:hypothetical protein